MRVLIVGVDSTIGAALAKALKSRGYAVIGTSRRKEICRDDTVFLDLTAHTLSNVPESDVTVICAAMGRFHDCRNDPKLALRVNVLAPLEIARLALRTGGRVIFLSTSAVFDCLKPHRKVDSPPAPRSAYGRFKAQAENKLLELGNGITILRLTKIIQQEKGVLPTWIKALAAGQKVTAFDDHSFSPLSLNDVVEPLGALVEQGATGIFQISGADDISYANAAAFLAKRVGAPESRVTSISAADGGIIPEEVTPYTSLDCVRLTEITSFDPPKAKDVIDKVYAGAFEAVRACKSLPS